MQDRKSYNKYILWAHPTLTIMKNKKNILTQAPITPILKRGLCPYKIDRHENNKNNPSPKSRSTDDQSIMQIDCPRTFGSKLNKKTWDLYDTRKYFI